MCHPQIIVTLRPTLSHPHPHHKERNGHRRRSPFVLGFFSREPDRGDPTLKVQRSLGCRGTSLILSSYFSLSFSRPRSPRESSESRVTPSDSGSLSLCHPSSVYSPRRTSFHLSTGPHRPCKRQNHVFLMRENGNPDWILRVSGRRPSHLSSDRHYSVSPPWPLTTPVTPNLTWCFRPSSLLYTTRGEVVR